METHSTMSVETQIQILMLVQQACHLCSPSKSPFLKTTTNLTRAWERAWTNSLVCSSSQGQWSEMYQDSKVFAEGGGRYRGWWGQQFQDTKLEQFDLCWHNSVITVISRNPALPPKVTLRGLFLFCFVFKLSSIRKQLTGFLGICFIFSNFNIYSNDDLGFHVGNPSPGHKENRLQSTKRIACWHCAELALMDVSNLFCPSRLFLLEEQEVYILTQCPGWKGRQAAAL